MRELDRRSLLGRGLAVAGVMVGAGLVRASGEAWAQKGVPMIHVSDLFRPHCDPDDHWDLACAYALAYSGQADLKGVVIDFPSKWRKDTNPDIAAVSQMNFVTGLSVPVAVGSPIALNSRTDGQQGESVGAHGGVNVILNALRQSTEPVVISILGSSRDVAVAANREPELFARKCKAIYLNAGKGTNSKTVESLEHNVLLSPVGYAAIFDVPCPVYWVPCFGLVSESHDELFVVREYGSFYKFRQGDILPDLSDRVQKYFAHMFGKVSDHNWLGYLDAPKNEKLLNDQCAKYRNMWCTGGFLHAVGKTVLADGSIVRIEEAEGKAVFEFEPIKVVCDDSGITRWSHDAGSKNRFIFHVRDTENYQLAMTRAMKSLLTRLPWRAGAGSS